MEDAMTVNGMENEISLTKFKVMFPQKTQN